MPRASGGFGGGGSRGGGYGGGGFGGGGYHHHHYHRPYRGFFFFPWHRPYFGYGGFFGGFWGLFFLPIIILVLAGIFLISSILSLVSVIAQGGVVEFNLQKFKDYSYAEYTAAFSDESPEDYEYNLLLVFSTREGYDEYYTIAQVGNYLIDDVHYAFEENGPYHASIERSLQAENYNESLDRDLYSIITALTSTVKSYGDPYLRQRPKTPTVPESKVIEKDENLEFTGEMTKEAVAKFTEETGIPLVLVIEDEEDIFGKGVPAHIIISGVISLGISVFCIVWIVKSAKAKKQAKKEAENKQNGTDYNDPRYWN